MRLHEESLPAHRARMLTWSDEADARLRLVDSTFCHHCAKLSLASESEARSYIGLLLINKQHRRDEFTLRPYKCPRNHGWHVGRDRRTADLLTK